MTELPSPNPRDQMEFFEKYRRQNVGPTRQRLLELIALFEAHRHELTVRELDELRVEMDELTDRLRTERDLVY